MNRNDKEFLTQKIRSEYMENGVSELDRLSMLDRKVKRPANILAYTLGTVAALIMGSGMSLVMTEVGSNLGIANPLIPGIIIGVIGMLLAIANYPIYKTLLTARRKKFAPQIIALSDKILGE